MTKVSRSSTWRRCRVIDWRGNLQVGAGFLVGGIAVLRNPDLTWKIMVLTTVILVATMALLDVGLYFYRRWRRWSWLSGRLRWPK